MLRIFILLLSIYSTWCIPAYQFSGDVHIDAFTDQMLLKEIHSTKFKTIKHQLEDSAGFIINTETKSVVAYYPLLFKCSVHESLEVNTIVSIYKRVYDIVKDSVPTGEPSAYTKNGSTLKFKNNVPVYILAKLDDFTAEFTDITIKPFKGDKLELMVPLGVYCDKYTESVPIPKIPDQYSMSLTSRSQFEGFAEDYAERISLDAKRKLASVVTTKINYRRFKLMDFKRGISLSRTSGSNECKLDVLSTTDDFYLDQKFSNYNLGFQKTFKYFRVNQKKINTYTLDQDRIRSNTILPVGIKEDEVVDVFYTKEIPSLIYVKRPEGHVETTVPLFTEETVFSDELDFNIDECSKDIIGTRYTATLTYDMNSLEKVELSRSDISLIRRTFLGLLQDQLKSEASLTRFTQVKMDIVNQNPIISFTITPQLPYTSLYKTISNKKFVFEQSRGEKTKADDLEKCLITCEKWKNNKKCYAASYEIATKECIIWKVALFNMHIVPSPSVTVYYRPVSSAIQEVNGEDLITNIEQSINQDKLNMQMTFSDVKVSLTVSDYKIKSNKAIEDEVLTLDEAGEYTKMFKKQPIYSIPEKEIIENLFLTLENCAKSCYTRRMFGKCEGFTYEDMSGECKIYILKSSEVIPAPVGSNYYSFNEINLFKNMEGVQLATKSLIGHTKTLNDCAYLCLGNIEDEVRLDTKDAAQSYPLSNVCLALQYVEDKCHLITNPNDLKVKATSNEDFKTYKRSFDEHFTESLIFATETLPESSLKGVTKHACAQECAMKHQNGCNSFSICKNDDDESFCSIHKNATSLKPYIFQDPAVKLFLCKSYDGSINFGKKENVISTVNTITKEHMSKAGIGCLAVFLLFVGMFIGWFVMFMAFRNK